MPLEPEDRKKLRILASIMLPGGAGMSGAIDIDLANDPVDRVLHIEPTLAPRVSRFLASFEVIRTLDDIESIAQKDSDGFKALGTLLANAYFMNELIRKQIGYPGQEARDSSGGLKEYDLTMLQCVLERGPVHRQL